MAGQFCVFLTRALEDPDRATVAFVIANAASAPRRTPWSS